MTWLGQVPFEDLAALLGGADLFVYPSLYEGVGLPPLEAMACGTPVVASRATSLPEVIGDAGVLVDASRVEDLAEAMHRVITDRELHATGCPRIGASLGLVGAQDRTPNARGV